MVLMISKGNAYDKAHYLVQLITGHNDGKEYKKKITWGSSKLRSAFYFMVKVSVLIPRIIENGIGPTVESKYSSNFDNIFEKVYQNHFIEDIFSGDKSMVTGEFLINIIYYNKWL